MKELKGNKNFKKPSPVKDAQGLNSLLGFLNNPAVTGAVVPKGAITKVSTVEAPESSGAVAIPETPIVHREPTPEQPPVSAPTTAPILLNKIAFTGRLMSGKDFAAASAGLTIFSLAQPLYALQKLFFGTDDKTLPGAREFLQTAGQIGRGELSADLPLSIERANFIALVREQANRLPDDLSVDWQAYGRHENLWLDAMLLRVKKHLSENPGARVAITNARFENELKRLTAEGFVHRHVLCSASTWTLRLKTAGLTPEAPACKDVSERLAAALDADVTRKLSQQKTGVKLAAIWCDERVPAPSNRLFTVSEFVSQFPR